MTWLVIRVLQVLATLQPAVGRHTSSATRNIPKECSGSDCPAFLQQSRQLVIASKIDKEDEVGASAGASKYNFSASDAGAVVSDECFLAMTYNPTPAQLRRLLRYAFEVQDLARFIFVVDETRPVNGASVRDRLASLGVGGIDVHSFSEEAALRRHPHFWRFWNSWPIAAKKKYPSIAAWFMPLVLLDWFQTSQSNFCSRFWMITDDVGFNGNIANLVRSYQFDPADVIQGSYERIIRGRHWPMFRLQSKRLLRAAERKRVPLRFRLDNTQRLSVRALHALAKYARMGIIGTGEVWIPTIAGLDGLTVKAFDPQFVGHTFYWNGRVGPEEWLQLRMQNASQLYHALKF